MWGATCGERTSGLQLKEVVRWGSHDRFQGGTIGQRESPMQSPRVEVTPKEWMSPTASR